MLHRVLAANDLTFASQLIEARINVALQMLTSSSCTHLTTLEIACQAGFLSASHFARVVRKRTGRTPLELRGLIH
jgi:transcriptional regulator GlxA family with amidase domain